MSGDGVHYVVYIYGCIVVDSVVRRYRMCVLVVMHSSRY